MAKTPFCSPIFQSGSNCALLAGSAAAPRGLSHQHIGRGMVQQTPWLTRWVVPFELGAVTVIRCHSRAASQFAKCTRRVPNFRSGSKVRPLSIKLARSGRQQNSTAKQALQQPSAAPKQEKDPCRDLKRCVRRKARQWIQTQKFWTLTRVCGIQGARGLGGCFRISPLKAVASNDLQRLRRDCARIRFRQKNGRHQDTMMSVSRTQKLGVSFCFKICKGACPMLRMLPKRQESKRWITCLWPKPWEVFFSSGKLRHNQSQIQCQIDILAKLEKSSGKTSLPGRRPNGKIIRIILLSMLMTWKNGQVKTNEFSLLDLLVFLQQCQNKQLMDAEVASQITSRIARWKEKGHRTRQNCTNPRKTSVPVRESQVPPVTAVHLSEWAAPPTFCPKGMVLGAVSDGLEFEGNVTFARTLNDFWEIRDLWKATKCPLGLTVLVEQNGSNEGGGLPNSQWSAANLFHFFILVIWLPAQTEACDYKSKAVSTPT